MEFYIDGRIQQSIEHIGQRPVYSIVNIANRPADFTWRRKIQQLATMQFLTYSVAPHLKQLMIQDIDLVLDGAWRDSVKDGTINVGRGTPNDSISS